MIYDENLKYLFLEIFLLMGKNHIGSLRKPTKAFINVAAR